MNSESTQPRPSRWQTSKSLARSSWRVLKLDRKLASIPVLSTALTLGLAVIVGIIFFLTSSFSDNDVTGPLVGGSWVSIAFYAVFYLLFTFIATYFSAALVAGLLQRFRGESPTVTSALAIARAHIGSIFKFSLLTGIVGYILQLIEENVPFAGQIATWVLGAGWSIASMFALPVIVSAKEKVGPLQATRQSVDIIKKTWGETAILSVGIGLVGFLSFLAFIATMGAIGALTAYIVTSTLGSGIALGVSLGVVGFVGVVGLIVLALVFTMLSSVAKAAIFHYATTGEAPAGFEQDIIRASFTAKKARGVFGA